MCVLINMLARLLHFIIESRFNSLIHLLEDEVALTRLGKGQKIIVLSHRLRCRFGAMTDIPSVEQTRDDELQFHSRDVLTEACPRSLGEDDE